MNNSFQEPVVSTKLIISPILIKGFFFSFPFLLPESRLPIKQIIMGWEQSHPRKSQDVVHGRVLDFGFVGLFCQNKTPLISSLFSFFLYFLFSFLFPSIVVS